MTLPAQQSLPRSSRFRGRGLGGATLLLLLVPLALAVAEETPPPAAATVDDDLRIPDVFTSHLPQTLRDGDIRFFVHPHLGDFNLRDYLRISTGLRYGLTRHWEASLQTDAYLSHGLGDVKLLRQTGLSTLQLGTKYDLGLRPFAAWHSAIGCDFATPVSRPPADLTDGLRHFSPYLVSSRRLAARPDIRIFWGAALDLVSHTNRPRELHKNQLDDHATILSAGAVWDRHAFHYTVEMAWASTRLLGHTQDDTLSLRPGVIWEVPWFRSRRHPGRIVLLGAALRASIGPDGTDFGGGAKLRINFDPKRPPTAAPAPTR